MPEFTRKLTIFGCLLFTGFCFWKAALGLVDGTDASVVSTTEAAISPSYSHKRGITTPIQDIRPGMRIVGRNPNRIETESVIDPTPEGWRLLSVRMLKEDGSYFEAELLRPLSWISRHRAQPGATIQLNMPELHVVGAAEVLSISDCPPIDPGDGPVVLSTFKNVSNNVLNIYVEGEETPIGVTAGHPIWSEDRQAFVHSEKLQPGEKLRSALGRTVRITSIEPRAGPEAVYNLEVAGEHVYSITDSGLLVHNTCPPDVPELYQISRGTSTPRRLTPSELRAKYGHLTSEQRIARIDELSNANYMRHLEERLRSQEFVFRYLTEDGLAASYKYNSVRGYTTTEFTWSGSEVARRAQILADWNNPALGPASNIRYGVAIPVNKIPGYKLARPFGDSADFGWEFITNSYPQSGPGGWTQFLIEDVPLDDVFIFSLR